MTEEVPEEKPSSWTMFNGNDVLTPPNRRLQRHILAGITGEQASADGVTGGDHEDAIVVRLTVRFAGATRKLLEQISTAWFDHSEAYAPVTWCSLDEGEIRFANVVSVSDPLGAIAITRDALHRALPHVDLGEVVLPFGFTVEVSRESDLYRQDGEQ
ncbi:hypothetical protein [Saccharopolyspora sp. ASAGF58]|uniref:hypothetical protein n=1 Tax=Saccharopolyspora sp. ASAGF58 TaxID=2719023 RepID=UPI00143FC5C1|nr:hypothetical protein [Saccharopolyspora sp. ASAGF58]QIZ37032.1 hypothetical protein FDZ84_23265 [Saccharopolyspora sp. ASAGF58]